MKQKLTPAQEAYIQKHLSHLRELGVIDDFLKEEEASLRSTFLIVNLIAKIAGLEEGG